MSTTPFPGPYPTTIAHILVHHITTPAASRVVSRPAPSRSRLRPTRQQGRSLEILGHAIDYLIEQTPSLDRNDARKILLHLSREVLAETRKTVPARRRARPRLLRLLSSFNFA